MGVEARVLGAASPTAFPQRPLRNPLLITRLTFVARFRLSPLQFPFLGSGLMCWLDVDVDAFAESQPVTCS